MSENLSPAQIARKIRRGGRHNIVPPATAKRYRPPVYFTGRKRGFSGISAKGSTKGFDDSGMSGQMRGARPDIPYGAVWCGKCNKACDFEEGGLHNLFGQRDSSGSHRGYVLVRAICHGETAEITVTFEELRRNAGDVILAFPYPEGIIKGMAGRIGARLAIPALPSTPVRLLLRNRR